VWCISIESWAFWWASSKPSSSHLDWDLLMHMKTVPAITRTTRKATRIQIQVLEDEPESSEGEPLETQVLATSSNVNPSKHSEHWVAVPSHPLHVSLQIKHLLAALSKKKYSSLSYEHCSVLGISSQSPVKPLKVCVTIQAADTLEFLALLHW